MCAAEFFCSYYALEWFIRFMAFERKCNCLRDGWFVFDSASALFPNFRMPHMMDDPRIQQN